MTFNFCVPGRIITPQVGYPRSNFKKWKSELAEHYIIPFFGNCADTHRLAYLSMSSVSASLDLKQAPKWKQQGVSGEGILDPVLNMNCIVSYTNTKTLLTFRLME